MNKIYHKVVLIDDEVIQNKIHKLLIQHCFGRHYIEILSFTDPVQALLYLQDENAVKLNILVFLDLNMPSLSGWDFLDHLHYVNMNYLTVYIVSSSLLPEDIERAYNHHKVEGYLLKPVDSSVEKIFAPTLAAVAGNNAPKP